MRSRREESHVEGERDRHTRREFMKKEDWKEKRERERERERESKTVMKWQDRWTHGG